MWNMTRSRSAIQYCVDPVQGLKLLPSSAKYRCSVNVVTRSRSSAACRVRFAAGSVLLGSFATFAWSEPNELRQFFDLTSTAIFGYCGALVVIRHRPLGAGYVMWLAILGGLLTAVGGGTLRCASLSQVPFWLDRIEYLLAASVGALGCLGIHVLRRDHHADGWNAADSLALGIFVPIGVEQAFVEGAMAGMSLFGQAIAFGVLTGVGGGALRDLLLGRLPIAFCTTYAPVAVCGAILHVALYCFNVPGAWLLSALCISLVAYLSRHVVMFPSRKLVQAPVFPRV